MEKRECGNCSLCCRIAEVKEGNFYKPACESCKFLKQNGKGCSIFGSSKRPKICSSYECAWLRGYGEELDRPDLNDEMISISSFNGGTWIFVQETKKHAHLTTGKNIIIDVANKVDLPVIISDFDSKPGKDYGDYVLIKDKLDPRSSHIKGDFICDYVNEMKLYKLIIQ